MQEIPPLYDGMTDDPWQICRRNKWCRSSFRIVHYCISILLILFFSIFQAAYQSACVCDFIWLALVSSRVWLVLEQIPLVSISQSINLMLGQNTKFGIHHPLIQSLPCSDSIKTWMVTPNFGQLRRVFSQHHHHHQSAECMITLLLPFQRFCC